MLRKTRNMLSWLEFCIRIKQGKLTHDPGFGLYSKHGDKLSQVPAWMTLDDFIVLRKRYKKRLRGFKIEMIKHRIRTCLNKMADGCSDDRRRLMENKHSDLLNKISKLF